MRFILHSQQTGTFLHKTITLKKVPFKAISQLQYCRSLSTTRTDDFSPNVDHTPVLLSEVLERLKPKSDQWYCDATFGAGGYTRGILDAASCKVVAIDRDIEGIERANQLATQPAYTGRLLPIMGQFGHLRSLVEASTQLKEPCFDGIVFDIGVSSMQIDNAERGFSYRWDGPLDMRMDTLQPSDTAADLINSLDIAELERLFFTYGGEHHSRRIARAIGVARTQSPILRTSQLTELVLKTVRGRTADPYRSVARIFQSLRIQINDEIGELKRGLLAAERLLQPGGRLIVVNFHSLEDQITKDFLYRCAGRRSLEGKSKDRVERKQRRARKEQLAQNADNWMPTNTASLIDSVHESIVDDEKQLASSIDSSHEYESEYSFKLMERKAIRPTTQEKERNPRSQSAKLRYAIQTKAPSLAPYDLN